MAEHREFETGATRDTDNGKYDYEAFLSPLVLECYAEYMNKNRRRPNGELRDGDNWQKGIPQAVYMKSLWRHFMDVWKEHRGIKTESGEQDALCAVLFNAMGKLHELLKVQERPKLEVFPEPETQRPEAPATNPYIGGGGLLGLFRRN